MLGSVSFAALFASPLPFTVKLLVGTLVLLFGGYVEFENVQRSMYAEATSKLSEIGFLTLEAKLDGYEGRNFAEAYRQHLQGERLRAVATGGGSAYALMLCFKFALWLGGGAALSIYVMPALAQRFAQ